ncbi:MAG: M55 family metallopeptidase [Bacillota bacterium]
MKIYISADMEGISSVISGEETYKENKKYPEACEKMVNEVNKVIEYLQAEGVNEIIVNDSHSDMKNIKRSKLSAAAELITGDEKALSMMEGIDESFDGVIFVGYHARAGTSEAILDHTYTGKIHNIKVNDKLLGEIGINARVAGYFSVPVIAITGDQSAVRTAKGEINEHIGITVKKALGRESAVVSDFSAVSKKIKSGISKAVAQIDKFKPTVEEGEINFDVEFSRSLFAERAAVIPGIKKLDARTIRIKENDYLNAFKLFRTVMKINS